MKHQVCRAVNREEIRDEIREEIREVIREEDNGKQSKCTGRR